MLTALSHTNPETEFRNVTALLEKGVESGVYPGAALIVGRAGQVVFSKSVGNKSSLADFNTPMTIDTVFDVASLTNVLVTTTLIMKLIEQQKVRLEDRVCRYLQGFGVMGKSGITVGHLLSHTSGLPHWLPFFEDLLQANAGARLGVLTSRGAKDHIITQIVRAPLKYEAGTKQVYSDVGMILLGHLVEVLTGVALDKAAHKLIFQPLGLKSTSFIDLSMIKRRGIHPVTDVIAPTEDCSWRKRILCGEVHDDNAWAMGGIAGHSGIFTSAPDIHRLVSELIFSYLGHSGFLHRETVRSFWTPPSFLPHAAWRFGWDGPSKENGMIDSRLSARAVGINGFTGCSLWVEPEAGLHIIFLTNRVHPSRSNKKILHFRPEVHDAVIEAMTAAGA